MRWAAILFVVAFAPVGCGGPRPPGEVAVPPGPEADDALAACERRLLCNAPHCSCPEYYRCSLACPDCRAECVSVDPAQAGD